MFVCQSRDSKVRSRLVRALLRLSRRARRVSYSTQPTGQAVGDGTVSGRNTLERQFQHAGVVRDSRKYVYDSSGLARLVRRAERDVSLIVPNRPARRSATHGPTHGRTRARASKGAFNRDIRGERTIEKSSSTMKYYHDSRREKCQTTIISIN